MIAVVDGEEITIPELNAEARARGIVIGSDRAVRDALIKELVERKLLVREAIARKLDQTPDHLLSRRRLDEILLTQELTEMLNRGDSSPDAGQVAALIESRPQAFGERAIVSVDRIALPATVDPGLLSALANARTLDASQSLLKARGIAFERRSEVWDSASLTAQMMAQIRSRSEGKLVVLKSPDQVMLTRVIGVAPQPVPAQNRERMAQEMLRSERMRADYQRVLAQAKAAADIRYQPRFAPNR